MLTTRQAAHRLATVTSAADLTALAAALGFGTPLPLDRTTARRLGLPRHFATPQVATGRGTLRALLLELDADRSARESGVAISRALVRSTPELGWLIFLRESTTGRIVIAAPSVESRGAVPALEVDPAQVRDSDAESFAALAGCVDGPDVLVHLRWRETLGRDALTRRFYRELEAQVDHLATTASGRAPREARRSIALLHVSRLLFLAFLEARGWLDGDREFLRRHFSARAGGRGAHQRFLEPLWFGTLNTPLRHRAPSARDFGRVPFLNGGLFTRTPLERRWRDLRLADNAIDGVIAGLLGRYRLTARESSDTWSDAAVDPEMLGRAFESLMHAPTRRAQGAFYTPPALIGRLVHDGLVAALEPVGIPASAVVDAWEGKPLPAPLAARLVVMLPSLTVLDPACGSGAFLVYALERLALLSAASGDARPLALRRRDVLTRNIFGVDIDPTAVWLCQLRLWLSVVVEEEHDDPLRLPPLPNLDRNIREGDALAGAGFDDAPHETDALLATRRLRYARANGARKRSLGRVLEREERARAIAMLERRLAQLSAERREILLAARSPDLFAQTRGASRAQRLALDALRSELRRTRTQVAALRSGAALPFSFATHFPDVAAAGGFALVVGNPPWVRTHGIPAEQRESLRARFASFRSAAWERGAAAAAAGRGFASQADLAALFVERAVRLTAAQGAVALLLPTKLWSALAGGGVRQFLAAQAPPLALEDWSGSSAGFDAVVYPSALVSRRSAAAPAVVRATVHRHDHPLTFNVERRSLALDASPGAPWLLLPTEVRAAFDAVGQAGIPLAESAVGRPLLGVKSGCNEAFVIDRRSGDDASLDTECLRPLLRGEHLAAWRANPDAAHSAIIWTHDVRGEPLVTLPPATARHLRRWRRQLEQRSDGRGQRWWALFRTEAARSDRARVVWGDIGRAPRALVLPAGDPTVPLNTCYVLRTALEDDAHSLAALLNSPLAAAWLGAIAEPARGGYRRFLGWTCARFPLPREWGAARRRLAPIGRAAAQGELPDAWTLTEAVLAAYGLSHETVAPLLSWHAL